MGSEERLKLLCLMTLADVDAVSPETLTRWKEDLLWRVYVDTYNCLTLQYGDDVIERTETAAAECVAHRPADLEAAEVARLLEGLPRRYLQLFDRDAVYDHVRLARDIRPDEVHLRLVPAKDGWELTAVTLDKPMLFANICGVLSSFGMDILRGHAMTNPNGLVTRRLPVRRRRALPGAEPDASARRAARDRGRRGGPLERGGPPARPPARAEAAARRRTRAPVVHADDVRLAQVHRARDRRA